MLKHLHNCIFHTGMHTHTHTYITTRIRYCYTTVGTSELCTKKLQILHAIFVNSAQILCDSSTRFYYGTIACDTDVLSRVSWLVGPLKLRLTIQLTLLKMHCD